MIAVVGYHIQGSPSQLSLTNDSDEELQKNSPSNMKLKNELCRNYLQTGYCKYHQKCQFAHGVQELRQHQTTNNKYKTKKCLSYFDKACCLYGERCNFQHMRNNIQECQKIARSNFREVFWFVKPRLSLFGSSF